MGARPIRVLIVDDSAYFRQVLKDALSSRAGVEVVGTARDGAEALELVRALEPDVVTLDLVMPGLDGIGFLRAAAAVAPCRVVVVSSSTEENGLVLEALQLGAVDFVQKSTRRPGALPEELSADVVAKVQAAALAHGPSRSAPAAPAPPPWPRAPRSRPCRTELVVVGASTGGPQALGALLPELPADLPCPVAIALHMPVEYTASLAARLDGMSGVRVREARDGMPLVPGEVVLGRGGLHLVIERGPKGLVARLSHFPQRLHVPSVDVLFESAAAACGRALVGVVLTGMGDDGARGAAALRRAGAPVLTEAESTAVIYGMPRAVREAGLSSRELPLDAMASAIQAEL